ncbi:MAG: tyrosine-type recombinase/integrase, partial [Burkholderiales bacterium]|nr:tyrosine-type recombinase/integrase [Burkholderiales bacterium]
MRKSSSSTDTPDPLIDAFIDSVWLEDGLSALTLAAYRRDLNALALWLHTQHSSLATAVEADLQAYFAHRHDQTKATSANRRMTVFRRFYRWALRDNRLLADPTLKLLSARQPLRLPKSLSEAQVEALLNAPDTDTALGLRDRAMLELLYASGLRVSELVNLPLLSLNMREGVLRITGKGDKERLVPFGEEAGDWMQRYLDKARSELLKHKNSPAVFVTQRGVAMSRVMFWMLIKKYALLADIHVPLS